MYHLSLLPEAKASLELRNQQANVITTYYMGLSMSLYQVRITAKINLEILELQRERYIWASQLALVVKNSPANAGDAGRREFNPWVRKIPWRRSWQPTPVFLPGESREQRGLVGYSPWGHKEMDMTEATEPAEIHKENISFFLSFHCNIEGLLCGRFFPSSFIITGNTGADRNSRKIPPQDRI